MFPDFFDDDNNLEFYSNVQRQLIYELELIYSPASTDNIEKQLKAINGYFLNEIKPKSFNPADPESVLILHERQFYQLCSMLEANGIENPSKKSVVDIYSRMSFFKKRTQATKQA